MSDSGNFNRRRFGGLAAPAREPSGGAPGYRNAPDPEGGPAGARGLGAAAGGGWGVEG